MAKIPVAQLDGEISISPGGIEPQRTYQVVKGEIDVDDGDISLVTQALGLSALEAPTKEDLAGIEQASYERASAAGKAAAAAIDNAKAVADATAAGVARAASETKKPAKSAAASTP